MRLIPTVFLTSMSTIALAGNFYQTCDYVSEVNLSNVFFVLIAKYKDVNGNSNDASIDLNALVANIHGLGVSLICQHESCRLTTKTDVWIIGAERVSAFELK